MGWIGYHASSWHGFHYYIQMNGRQFCISFIKGMKRNIRQDYVQGRNNGRVSNTTFQHAHTERFFSIKRFNTITFIVHLPQLKRPVASYVHNANTPFCGIGTAAQDQEHQNSK